MPVTLSTLITACPFDDRDRQNLLASLEKFSEEKKFLLSNRCWTIIAQDYFGRLQIAKNKLLLEIQEGKRKFDKKDFKKAEEELEKEFINKLSSAENEASIEEVRDELKKYTPSSQPNVQPTSQPTPPSVSSTNTS